MMAINQVLLIFSDAAARAGGRKQNYLLPMEQPLIDSDFQFPSPLTMPLWELLEIMIMETCQVQHMFI